MTAEKIFDVEITKISIHTPAKGVTFAEKLNRKALTISIHTPAKGVT